MCGNGKNELIETPTEVFAVPSILWLRSTYFQWFMAIIIINAWHRTKPKNKGLKNMSCWFSVDFWHIKSSLFSGASKQQNVIVLWSASIRTSLYDNDDRATLWNLIYAPDYEWNRNHQVLAYVHSHIQNIITLKYKYMYDFAYALLNCSSVLCRKETQLFSLANVAKRIRRFFYLNE